MTLIRKVALAGALGLSVAMVSPASANLIVNGSFENPDIAPGTWKYFDSDDVSGWSGDNIEIWDNYGGVTAHEGTQFAELNAHPDQAAAFGIYQEFATVVGQTYYLSFAYQARRSGNEVFEASVSSGDSWTLDDHIVGDWNVFTDSFVADSALTRLTFTTVYPDGTIGNFLDDVVVTAPEPGTLALLGLGLAGLGAARRRRHS